MKPLRLVFLLLVGVFSFPQCALANVGTPLMWAGFLHLAFGNAVIGLGEGLLIAWLFSRRKLPCVLVMVAANYFSAWIGGLCIIAPVVAVLPLDLYNAWQWFWIMLAAAYAARWDLTASIRSFPEPRLVDLLTNQQVEPPMVEDDRDKEFLYEGRWSYGGDAKLGDAANSAWTFAVGGWPIEGLRATNRDTGKSVRFAYETPFGEWNTSNAVHLPTDKVLFQLGDDQICVFDPVKRRVALLWRGKGPTAAIEK